MGKKPYLLVISFAFIFTFLFSFSVLSKEEDEEIRLKKEQCGNGNFTFQIVALKDNVPFSWITKRRDKDGEIRDTLHGLDYEFLNKLIEGTSIKKIGFIGVDKEEDLRSFIINNKADIAVGSSYVNDKTLSKNFLYPSYIGNPIVAVFVKNKGKEVRRIEELKGEKIVSLKRDKLEDLLKYTLPEGSTLKTVEDTKSLFKELFSGSSDVALIGLYTATADSDKYKIKEDLYFSQTPLRYPRFFILMTQGRNCGVYFEEFQKRVKELSEDQEFLGNILAKTYKELSEINKEEPRLNISDFPSKEKE